jgi:hypothetical protein
MLTIRTDIPPPPPRPLSPLGMWTMFAEIRKDLGLPPPPTPAPNWHDEWEGRCETRRRLEEEGFPFATDEDLMRI